MSEQVSSPAVAPLRSAWPVWLNSSAFWAGVSIVTMWLVVLFVAIFGGDILSSTPGGTSTSVPVVVVLIPFVLAGTVVVARAGFRRGADLRGRQDGQGAQVSEAPGPVRSTSQSRAA